MELAIQLDEYSHEFEAEYNQVKSWFTGMKDLFAHLTVLRESINNEIDSQEKSAENLISICENFTTQTKLLKEEPSKTWYMTTILINMIKNSSHLIVENIHLVQNQIIAYETEILNEIDFLNKNICENISKNMKNISEYQKDHNSEVKKIQELQNEFEEAHLYKKSIEEDPKYMYNVNLIDKAVKKTLDLLNSIKEKEPEIKKKSDHLKGLKENLNNFMKEAFELVINFFLKSLWKIREIILRISQDKYEIQSKIYEIIDLNMKGITDIDINLNDYVERKYSESKNVFFDSLDSHGLSESNEFGINYSTACTSIINYSENFAECLRMRKKVIKSFVVFINNFSSCKLDFSLSMSKSYNSLRTSVSLFKNIGPQFHKTFQFYSHVYELNPKINKSFSAAITDKINVLLNGIVKDYKKDQVRFKENWKTFKKNIEDYKSKYDKLSINMENLRTTITTYRSQLKDSEFSTNESQKKKNQKLLQNSIEEETDLKNQITNHTSKLKLYLIDCIDFLKKTVKSCRDREYKRLNLYGKSLEAIGKYYKKFLLEYNETLKVLINLVNEIDIESDINSIFANYLKEYDIPQSYLDKTLKKIIKIFNNKFLEQEQKLIKNETHRKQGQSVFLDASDRSNANIMIKKNSLIRSNTNFYQNLNRINGFSLDESKIKQSPNNSIMNIKNQEFQQLNLNPMDGQEESHFSNGINDDEHTPHENQNINEEIEEEEKEVSSSDDGETENFNFLKKKDVTHKIKLNIKENELKEYMSKLEKKKEEKQNKKEKQGEKRVKYDKVFYLEEDEKVIESYACALEDSILLQGKLYITNKKLLFYSWFNNVNFFGKTKNLIPLNDIVKIEKKYKLKIFNNSISILTKKREFFFTSFILRDQCFHQISELINALNKDKEKNADVVENEEVKEEEGAKKAFSIGRYIQNLIKKSNFQNRLNKLTEDREALFEKEGIITKTSSFVKTFYDKEDLAALPLPHVFKNLFDLDTVNEELEKGKNFWESYYESRKDYDITKENLNVEIPKYFDDLEYFYSIFTNFNEDNINQLLTEAEKWPVKASSFTFKLIHPIKKTAFGPDKVILCEEYKVCFISPKKIIVEVKTNSSGFPFCDTFYNMMQYNFETNFKYNTSEEIFTFKTTCTICFSIIFVGKTMFRSTIEGEGYKESENNARFFTFDKFKQVAENQATFFQAEYSKLNEESNSRFTNFEIDEGDNNENPENEEVKDDPSKIIQNSISLTINSHENLIKLYKKKEVAIPYAILVLIYVFKYLSIWDLVGFERLTNIVTLLGLGFIIHKYYKNKIE